MRRRRRNGKGEALPQSHRAAEIEKKRRNGKAKDNHRGAEVEIGKERDSAKCIKVAAGTEGNYVELRGINEEP